MSTKVHSTQYGSTRSSSELTDSISDGVTLCGKSIAVILLVASLVAAVVTIMALPDKKLVEGMTSLIVFTRHGERLPLIPIPDMGPFEIGDLTEGGKAQMQVLGSRLYQHYQSFVEGVRRPRVVSTNESRCMKSADILMKSMNLGDYEANYIAPMVINPKDGHYDEFLTKEKEFQAAVPDCMKQISRTLIEKLNISLPEEFKMLFGILIADSLDSVRAAGSKLPYGLDEIQCSIGVNFFTEAMYSALNELCIASFCKPAFRVFIEELQKSRLSPESDVVAYSLSDVHVSGLLSVIDPSKKLKRPQFGAHILFHVFSEDVEIYYGRSHKEQATLWMEKTNIHQIIEKIQQSIM